jgi:hypothetical protein
MGTPSFISKKNFCMPVNPDLCVCQPFFASEQHAQRGGHLPMLVSFNAGRERTRKAQDIAPFPDEII